jgi:hypothetical protein
VVGDGDVVTVVLDCAKSGQGVERFGDLSGAWGFWRLGQWWGVIVVGELLAHRFDSAGRGVVMLWESARSRSR